MRHPCPAFLRVAMVCALSTGASSCLPLTWDCGGPTTRETLASATLRAPSDTVSIDGLASTYEERDANGAYLHQLVIAIQATNAAHYDTIPSVLRPHVTGARIELAAGTVLYHVSMSDNTSQRYGPPVLAAIPINDADQSLFDTIRSHLLAEDAFFVVEADSSALQFPRTRLAVTSSYDWRKSSGCK